MPFAFPKISVKTVEPYSHLAPVYDYVMRHVNYERWANYIIRIFEYTRFSPRRILDIACGTGTVMKYLLEAGYRVDGNDLSPFMIEEAKRKISTLKRPLPAGGKLWSQDMSILKTDSVYEAIICLYDSFNYLLDEDQAYQAVQNVYRLLQSPGLFIFDICTERNSVEFFDNYYEKGERGGWKFSRKSYYQKRKRLHINEFTLEHERIVYHEIHQQRIYKIEEIKKIILKTNFELLYTLDDTTLRPGSEKSSDRVHFIVKKH